MTLRATPILRPHYSEQFRCIGPDCEDSCCIGWTIAFDRLTMDRYQALPDSDLKFKILANTTPVPANHSSCGAGASHVAHRKPNGDCAFLRDDHLCEIHATLGEAALSKTCSNFPRIRRSIDNLDEAALTLGCPEAARLILLNPALLNPALLNPSTTQQPTTGHYQFKWDDATTSYTPLKAWFWPIRDFSIQLLKNRRYPLWQRLFLLGLYARRLDAIAEAFNNAEDKTTTHTYTPNNNAHTTPNYGQLHNDFAAAIASGSLRPAMEKIPAQIPLQLKLVWNLIELRFNQKLHNPRLLALLSDFHSGIGNQTGISLETQSSNYSSARTKFFQPLIDRHPHILENYLINQIFRASFPFDIEAASQLPPSANYARLALQFALIKAILIGIAAKKQSDFSPADIVRAIQTVTRNFEHDPLFLTQSLDRFKADGNDSPHGYATLLRD